MGLYKVIDERNVSSSGSTLRDVINYITGKSKKEEIEFGLQEGINCSPLTAYDEMMLTKQKYNKLDGRQYKHTTISFSYEESKAFDSPEEFLEFVKNIIEERINYEKENPTITESRKLKNGTIKERQINAKCFDGFEHLICVHQDKNKEGTDETRFDAHIITNTVSAETGLKAHWADQTLYELKAHLIIKIREKNLETKKYNQTHKDQPKPLLLETQSDKTVESYVEKIVKKMNKPIELTKSSDAKLNIEVKQNNERPSLPRAVYYILDEATNKNKNFTREKSPSIYNMCEKVLIAKYTATSKEDFINKLREEKIEVSWIENHKYITFTDSTGFKMRNSKIEKVLRDSFSKESLNAKFFENETANAAREGYRNAIGTGENGVQLTSRDIIKELQAGKHLDKQQQHLDKQQQETKSIQRTIAVRTTKANGKIGITDKQIETTKTQINKSRVRNKKTGNKISDAMLNADTALHDTKTAHAVAITKEDARIHRIKGTISKLAENIRGKATKANDTKKQTLIPTGSGHRKAPNKILYNKAHPRLQLYDKDDNTAKDGRDLTKE